MKLKEASSPAALSDKEELEDGPPQQQKNYSKFLDLPFEIRAQIYELALLVPFTIDLSPSNKTRIAPQLRLFRTCRKVYEEAYPLFYSKQTFQIFPTHPAHLNAKPRQLLLTRLPRKYRERITSLQLRFGPGWGNPPKCQAVKPKLGLADCTSVRTLKVFVECDPSQDVFKNFRFNETFYTMFCSKLLEAVLEHLDSVRDVEFDGYPSVKRGDALMQELIGDVERAGRRITWGPLRRWDEDEEDENRSDSETSA